MDLNQIVEAVISGDQFETERLAESAINEGITPEKIIYDGLVKGMNIVAEKWKAGDYFVPEVLRSSRAMKFGMAIVKPHLQREMEKVGTIVLGTVKGDIHDIGKNLVLLMMEAAGFKAIDLGTNVDKEVFVKSALDSQAQLVGLSALLTTTINYMKEVIDAFEKAGVRSKFKILVGGAPVSQKLADSIGADGYAKNAAEAVELAKALLK